MTLSDAQRRILECLRDGPQQAKDVAQALGIETSSAHRHLVRLHALKMVDYEDVSDGPGRPRRLYALTAIGMETFPRDYGFLLEAVLREVENQHGRPAVLRLMAGIAKGLAGRLQDIGDLETRLGALVTLYNELGFESSLQRSGDDLVLVQKNCPFLKTARAEPRALCLSLDEGLIREALPDAEVLLDRTMARGDLACRHIIRLGARRRPASA